MAAGDWAGLTHFTADEFAQPAQMGLEFMMWLDNVRHLVGVPMHVSSSYRSSAHNKAVGGAADSAHCDSPCNAVDIAKTPTADDPHWNVARGRIVRAAYAAGCVRVGFYPNGSLHLDRTEDRRPAALWNAVDVKA
jgi:uncharacterized protein YcbK (DUF882 family)